MSANIEDAVQLTLGRDVEQQLSSSGPTHIFLSSSQRFSDTFELYRRAFAALKLPDMFVPFELPQVNSSVDFEGLKSLMSLFRATPALQSLVVSGSFQRHILPHLDRAEKSAADLGYVNLVRKVGNEIVGENIAGDAFLLGAQEELGITFHRRSAVFFGCGAVSAAVSAKLAPQIMKVALVDTRIDRAHSLAEKLRSINPKLKISLSDRSEELDLRDFDVFYNGTGLGRQGTDLSSCLLTPLHAFDEFPKEGFAFDASYSPWETAFLRRFLSLDFETLNGFSQMIAFSSIHLSMITTHRVPYEFLRTLAGNPAENATSPWV